MLVLKNAIADGSCLLSANATTMEEICREGVDFLVQAGHCDEATSQAILTGLMNRERVSPTAIGSACAIPHYYDDKISEPRLVFMRLKHPANLGAPDGVATHFVFLLVGPSGRAAEHLDTLASIARLMSDREFHFDAAHAKTRQDLIEALDRYDLRYRPPARTTSMDRQEGLFGSWRPMAGIISDLRRRLPHYLSDFADGFQRKVIASTIFMFFACLAPAVTFGGIMGLATEGAIGAVEMLVATAVCGVLYALFAGQPLILLGGIGPLYIFTLILFQLCQDMDLGDQFLGIYGWVGIWTGLMTILLAITNASNLMRYFTRFTDEIFSTLMSLIFIYEAVRALIKIFHNSFSDPTASHDSAFLSLLLALGTFYVATALSRFRRSHYLLPWMREFLADFGPSIALTLMAVTAWLLKNEVPVPSLEVGSGFGTTSGRPWLINFGDVPGWIKFAAALPALLATTLIYLSQNITARLVNDAEHKLKKGPAYHWDLGLVGLLTLGCSLFAFPWLVAASVRSLAHVRALADIEEVALRDGGTKDRIIHTYETRVTALGVHLLIAATLLCLPLLTLIPMASLYGIFLYMGIVSMTGNQLVERMGLWLMDSAMYPVTHYTRQVPMRTIHYYTLLQFTCLLILCLTNISSLQFIKILFPIFIALLVPIRSLASLMFSQEHLAILDSSEDPDVEQSHWF